MNIAKASPIEIADEIISQSQKIVKSGDVFYVYNGQYYEPLTDDMLGQEIFNLYIKEQPDAWSVNKTNNIIAAIKYHPLVKHVPEMDAYDDYMNLTNGILQFSTKELHPHSDDFFFTTMVNVPYDPTATEAPAFMEFLNTVFTDANLEPDFHTIENILQLGGYLIYPQIKMEKMFIFYGTGANGKSLLIDYVFKKFFDKKFLSSLSLNVLSNESSTSRKQLLRSRVNFATEQKSSDAIESEELKKVITGEDISIERKYEDTIMHQPKCKIVVAGNRFMRFKDTSEGTRRRLMIFSFDNRFETNIEKYKRTQNPKAKRIFLAKNKDEMVSNFQKELPAILNLFLDGLQQLKDNNWHFYESMNNEKVFGEYLEDSDYIGTWLTDNLQEDPNGLLPIKKILEQYRNWWQYNFPDKKFDMSTRLIGRRIKDLFRIDAELMNILLDGRRTTTSCYKMKFIEDETVSAIDELLNSDEQQEIKQEQML